MRMLTMVFGVLAILIGLAIYGWVGYNLLWPTEAYEKADHSPRRYIFPGLMIVIGIAWVRKSWLARPVDARDAAGDDQAPMDQRPMDQGQVLRDR